MTDILHHTVSLKQCSLRTDEKSEKFDLNCEKVICAQGAAADPAPVRGSSGYVGMAAELTSF